MLALVRPLLSFGRINKERDAWIEADAEKFFSLCSKPEGRPIVVECVVSIRLRMETYVHSKWPNEF